jgi:Na+-translocating ferredoxin:NAD+ oxidoreductase RnfG subunit
LVLNSEFKNFKVKTNEHTEKLKKLAEKITRVYIKNKNNKTVEYVYHLCIDKSEYDDKYVLDCAKSWIVANLSLFR